LCTYAQIINADQLTDNLTDLTKALQKLEQVITGQPQSITDQIDGNLIHLNIIQSAIKFDLAQLAGYKTQSIKPSIPYDANLLDDLKMNLQEINSIVQFFTTNKTIIPANDKKQFGRQLFDIKNNLVQILTHLSSGVTTAAQATTLLQYIDEFYTKGIAAAQYRNFLGSSNYKVSDGQVASITKNMNAITQKAASSTSQSTQTTSQRPTLSSAQIAELTTLITNINAFDQKVTDLVNKNDIDELYNFMTNKTMGNYVDFTTLTQKYAPYLQQEAKKQIVGLLFSIHLKLINIDRSNPKRDAILDESSKTSKFVKQNI
jgi:hypothetical protein